MPTVATLIGFLEEYAPTRLAESWDNVGLLVGDRAAAVSEVMTCLTITPDSAAEAVDEGAQLIVTHHPLPFRPIKQLTTDTVEGQLLWSLIRAGISIYSPHTAFDSAREGINQRLADLLQLQGVAPLVPAPVTPDEDSLGAGRHGRLPKSMTLAALAGRVKLSLGASGVHVVGAAERSISRVAVACGSGGDFLGAARETGCDCLVTGETRFHTALEAEATGIALILAGHYATERFGVERLAEVLSQRFPDVSTWPSRLEHDPLAWM